MVHHISAGSATGRWLRQVERSRDHPHVVAPPRQVLDKALKAGPVVAVEAGAYLEGSRAGGEGNGSRRQTGVWVGWIIQLSACVGGQVCVFEGSG